MKRMTVVLACVLVSSLSWGALWQNDCSSLDGWGSAGAAVIDSSNMQLNSWWAGPGWSGAWTNTGITIQDETEYNLIINATSYGTNTPEVIFSSINGSNVWTDFSFNPIAPSTNGWADLTVSFSTVGASAYDTYVGTNLGVVVAAGWWSNIAVNQLTLVPEPATLSLLGFGALAFLKRKK